METIRYHGYRIDPCAGVVFGARGKPITKINTGGYVQAQRRIAPPIQVHRLIWEAVHGSIPSGLQVNHINGVKNDNRIANLELVTGSENTRHAYRLGLRRADGEKNGRAKLSAAQVLEIRKSGESSRALARRYGVSPTTIRSVLSRKNWRDVA